MSFPFPSVEPGSTQPTYTTSDLERILLADSDDEDSHTVKRFRTYDASEASGFELPHLTCEEELQRVMRRLELKESQLNGKLAEERQQSYQLKLKEAELHAKVLDEQKCKKYRAIAKSQQHMMKFYNEWVDLASRANSVLRQLVPEGSIRSDELRQLLAAYEAKTDLLSSAINEHNQRMEKLNSKFHMVADDEELTSAFHLGSSSNSSPSKSNTSEVRYKGTPRHTAHATKLSEARQAELKRREANKLLLRMA